MKRLTKRSCKVRYFHYAKSSRCEKIETQDWLISVINKLGQLEDLMEKYEIKSIEELEEILKDYDNMAKDIVEMMTGRKVDFKQ